MKLPLFEYYSLLSVKNLREDEKLYKLVIEDTAYPLSRDACMKSAMSIFNDYIDASRIQFEVEGDWKEPLKEIRRAYREMDEVFGNTDMQETLKYLFREKVALMDKGRYRKKLRKFVRKKYGAKDSL